MYAGAAAFFGGLTRLTSALAVIMIELTDETHFLLPIMTAGESPTVPQRLAL